MKNKIVVASLAVLVMALSGLCGYLGWAYLWLSDRCAAMHRQYVQEAMRDAEVLRRLAEPVPKDATNALDLIREEIALREQRMSVGPTGDGYHEYSARHGQVGGGADLTNFPVPDSRRPVRLAVLVGTATRQGPPNFTGPVKLIGN